MCDKWQVATNVPNQDMLLRAHGLKVNSQETDISGIVKQESDALVGDCTGVLNAVAASKQSTAQHSTAG